MTLLPSVAYIMFAQQRLFPLIQTFSSQFDSFFCRASTYNGLEAVNLSKIALLLASGYCILLYTLVPIRNTTPYGLALI